MPLGIENVGRAFMHRIRRGLYAGKEIKFGNKVSEDGGNKSRRTWKPNVHWKRVYSLTLDKWLRLRMTTHAMRCIDKAGGIDEYLLTTPDRKLNSDVGLHWKEEIKQAQEELLRAQEATKKQEGEVRTGEGGSATASASEPESREQGGTAVGGPS